MKVTRRTETYVAEDNGTFSVTERFDGKIEIAVCSGGERQHLLLLSREDLETFVENCTKVVAYLKKEGY